MLQPPRTKEANTFALRKGHDNYVTQADFRAFLDSIYHFDSWDPCPINEKGIREYDGLGKTPLWVKSYFYNPPYSNVTPWLENSIADWRRGVLSCALLKADTSTVWMHDLVFPYATPIWVRGRLSFDGKDPAPFNSCAAVFEPGLKVPQQRIMYKTGAAAYRDGIGTWHIFPEVQAVR